MAYASCFFHTARLKPEKAPADRTGTPARKALRETGNERGKEGERVSARNLRGVWKTTREGRREGGREGGYQGGSTSVNVTEGGKKGDEWEKGRERGRDGGKNAPIGKRPEYTDAHQQLLHDDLEALPLGEPSLHPHVVLGGEQAI